MECASLGISFTQPDGICFEAYKKKHLEHLSVVSSQENHVPRAKGTCSLVNLVSFLGPEPLIQPKCVLAKQIAV